MDWFYQIITFTTNIHINKHESIFAHYQTTMGTGNSKLQIRCSNAESLVHKVTKQLQDSTWLTLFLQGYYRFEIHLIKVNSSY